MKQKLKTLGYILACVLMYVAHAGLFIQIGQWSILHSSEMVEK